MQQSAAMMAATEKTTEYVFFEAAQMLCGLATLNVQEINRYTDITIVHRAPPYVRGVVNLRGEIVTVIDLRGKLGLDLVPLNSDMQIIIVRHGEENIGILVDRVLDVVAVDPQEVEPPPSNLGGVEGAFFVGVYKLKTELVALLSLATIVKSDEG